MMVYSTPSTGLKGSRHVKGCTDSNQSNHPLEHFFFMQCVITRYIIFRIICYLAAWDTRTGTLPSSRAQPTGS